MRAKLRAGSRPSPLPDRARSGAPDPSVPGGAGRQEDGGGETIVFSPVLNFYGKADREEVEEATRISFEEFKRLYKRLKAEERRKKFKPEPVTG